LESHSAFSLNLVGQNPTLMVSDLMKKASEISTKAAGSGEGWASVNATASRARE